MCARCPASTRSSRTSRTGPCAPTGPRRSSRTPSSAPNLWFLTYRDNSPLQASDWDGYRDPDALTYKAYVGLQSEAEAKVQGVLEAHADAGSDAALSPGSVALLAHLFTPSRYLCHGFQQVEAYIGYMAPSSYITNAAAFSTADFLRRVTTIAYRTRELQISRPDSGIGSAERVTVGGRRRLAAGPQGGRVRAGQLRLGGGVHGAEPGPGPDPG